MTNQAIDTPPLWGALFFRLFLPSLLQPFWVRPWRWRYVHSMYRLSMVKQPQTLTRSGTCPATIEGPYVYRAYGNARRGLARARPRALHQLLVVLCICVACALQPLLCFHNPACLTLSHSRQTQCQTQHQTHAATARRLKRATCSRPFSSLFVCLCCVCVFCSHSPSPAPAAL